MADIQVYLNNILNAVYGEEVRDSIHDAIDIINKVGEVTLTLGTAVTSTSSSTTGYYKNSVYLNTNTWDVWRCSGTAWAKMGNVKGGSPDKMEKTGTKANTNGLVDIYTVSSETGQSLGTIEITNANKLTASQIGAIIRLTFSNADGTKTTNDVPAVTKIGIGTSVTSTNTSTTVDDQTYYNNDIYLNSSTSDLWRCVGNTAKTSAGTSWSKIGNLKGEKGDQGIQGIKGDQGDKGDTGAQGPQGFSPLVSTSKSGKVTTVTITDVTGPHTIELRDGADGSGTGDMIKSTYDKDDDGVVDEAKKLSAGSMDNIPTAGSGNAITSGGVYAQVGNLNDLKTEIKDNLVAAINEAAESGGASEDYVQKSGDTMTGPLIIYDQTDTDSTAAEDKYRLDLGYRKSGSTIGLGSMVMGREATSSGIHSIAEGNSCVATGNYSSARGSGTTASGNFSVADGNGSQATALGAHVSGLYNRATQEYQMVVGKYNNYNDDENHVDAIFEVGNGTAISNRQNALQVMKNGDLRVQGDIYLQDGTSLADYIRSIVS